MELFVHAWNAVFVLMEFLNAKHICMVVWHGNHHDHPVRAGLAAEEQQCIHKASLISKAEYRPATRTRLY